MPFYKSLGNIPEKRHTTFKKPDGAYYYEQLFGTEGFHGMSSLMYHVHRPTIVKDIRETIDLSPKIAEEKSLKSRALLGFKTPIHKDILKARTPLLVNNDVCVSVAHVEAGTHDYFYKNADADELVFIHEGEGVLRTQMGQIPFVPGDYVLIPRGMIHTWVFKTTMRLLFVESYSPVLTPKRYRNEFGQLLEHSPFCERDIRVPQDLETIDEKGDFLIKIKKEHQLYHYVYGAHPFDVVGWDGYNFPYAFSIHNFEPITGRIHQPPPIHQTFEAHNFVVCSFCPRLYDYHPQAVPAPYNHSNIDSDEVLYYVDGDFMSRNHIERGMLTLHPGGIPHGPHPGAMERSIGKKETLELAVMVDTFKPLKITEQALKLDTGDYHTSWMEEGY